LAVAAALNFKQLLRLVLLRQRRHRSLLLRLR
jgi:hypothetical protein